MASSQTKTATTTIIATTSGAGVVTTATSGSVVTLTASVNAGATTLTAGQVNFCDASTNYCTDIHLLGTAPLTSAGTAVLRFRPGIGSHSYKAVFLGTKINAASASSASALTVTGTAATFASTTTIAETGSWGQYSLTATVTEAGGTVSPTGTVSFLDTSNGSSVLNALPLGASVAGISWPNPQGLPTNAVTQAVALGDFNGDGIPDIVAVAGAPTQPLMIWLGNANGTYTAAPTPAISAYTFGPIIVADFNGDGNQDLAILNGDTNTVSILLGNGDGTFTVTASSPATGSSPNQLAVGDFNGDGIADLAVTSSSSNTINILLGNGDGTFTAAFSSPVVSGSPHAIAVGDLNGDGQMDLVITDTYDDTVSILLGNGDGTFAASNSVNCGSNGSPIAIADFNGDGKLDLAVGVGGATGSSDSVAILVGNGDGTFSSASTGPAVSSSFISSVQAGDFNGDGIADLVLADSKTGIVGVFLSNGSGSFNATSFSTAVADYYQLDLALGDINGDGRTDLVVGNYFGDTVTSYLTEPTETATASANISLAEVGQHLVDASYGGDGNYNSSVSNKTPLWGVPPATTTSLSLTSGAAQVTSVAPGTAVTLTATVMAGARPVTPGQVNFCDASASQCTDIHLLGTAELTSSGTAAFKFVPGAGQHSYKAVFVEDGWGLNGASNVATLTVGPAPAPAYTISTSIAQTGIPGNYSLTATVEGLGGTAAPTGSVSFLDTSFGNTSLATAPLGLGTAGLGWLISQTPAASSSTTFEVTGDFNGDGIPDLALLGTNNIYNDPPFSVTILLGNGDGTFTTGPTTTLPTAAQGIVYMMAGNFNGDGKTDLVLLTDFLSYPSGATVISFLGKGDGTFSISTASTVVLPEQGGGDVIQPSMVAADFNGDGKFDLAIVGNYISGGVSILLGNGDGTFTATATNPEVNRGLGMIATGDFNRDGIPDLVVSDYFGPSVGTILLGKGDGTFTKVATPLTVNSFGQSAVVGDFNADGLIDLAIGSNGSVAVYAGNGDGTFNPVAGSPFSGPGVGLTAGDFNHDGRLDLAGLDTFGDQVDVLIGAGDGTFTNSIPTPNVSQSSLAPFAIVAADFNADGVPDLAMLTRSVNTASILLTNPTETTTATVNGIAPIGVGTHNVDASYFGDSTFSSSISSTLALYAGLAPLVISPSAGTYSSVQTITIGESIPGATIYFSESGTVNTNGFVPYTGPISLTSNGTETIQAYATETGYQSSNLSATFTLNLPTPTPVISPAQGSYASAQTVTITDAAPGATIYYTTDGTTPTTSSTKYAGAITVSSTETVKAIAAATGLTNSAVATAVYTIHLSVSTPIGTTSATVSVTPSALIVTDQQQVSVTVSVAGAGAQPTPTGSVILASGAYNAEQSLTAGTAIFKIPAGILSAGANTLTVSYSGDATYGIANGNATVTVSQVVIAVPAPSAVSPGNSATGTVTVSAGSTYSGTMNLTCTLTTSPSGAQSLPTCSVKPVNVTIAAGGNGTSALTIQTKAATTAAFVEPSVPKMRWLGGGGAALAAVLLFGLPARRRRWISGLALLLAISSVGAIGCAGGGGQATAPPSSIPATTAGRYTFSVTGTDGVNKAISTSTNVVITVQ